MLLMESSDGETMALTHSTTAKGGKLRHHQGQMTHADLEHFLGQVFVLTVYIQDIMGFIWRVPDHENLALLEKPLLPAIPRKQYHSPIELRRQHLASKG